MLNDWRKEQTPTHTAMEVQRVLSPILMACVILTVEGLQAQDVIDEINALKQEIDELERKVRALERQRELEREESATRKRKTPLLTVGDQGFSLRSESGDFSLRVRSLVQADGRFYFSGARDNDGFLIRRARIELTGTLFRKFDFRIMPDFAGSSPTLLDAWLDWKVCSSFQVLAGKSKLPVGLERFQSRENNLMTEFGYPTSLVPNRDIGIAVHGAILGGGLDYYLGAFNGTTDGGSSVANADGDETLAARLFARPFKRGGPAALQGLGMGVGGTYGEAGGTPSNYSSVGQRTFYRWLSGVVIDGTTWRVDPQLCYFYGPFGLLGDYAISSQRVSSGSVSRTVRNEAWQVTVSYVLTGEDASFNGVTPRKPVDPAAGAWGAWQVVGRVTELDVDGDAFPSFANPTTSASRARSYGGGWNWYLNSMVRLSMDYNFTKFQGAPLADEHVLFSRVQFRF